MSQNTSSAVMAQRVEPPDSLDFFPTPPWATRALLEHVVIGHGWGAHELAALRCWEPACGEGDMARPLAEYFGTVTATDVHDYGFGGVHDFLMGYLPPGLGRARPDFVVTNPPFRLAADFVARGRAIARQGVAVLVRTAFLEGAARWRDLYAVDPPALVAPFVERVPMFKGRLDAAGSTATSYAWFVWSRRPGAALPGTRLVWIPPCRRDLERPGDYA